jgi:hypothetical protein
MASLQMKAQALLGDTFTQLELGEGSYAAILERVDVDGARVTSLVEWVEVLALCQARRRAA